MHINRRETARNRIRENLHTANQSGPRMPEPIGGEACEEDAEADGAVDGRANDRARHDEPACDREDRGTDGMAWSAKGAISVPGRPGRGSGHGNSRTKY